MAGPASIRPKRVNATDLAYTALKSHGEAMHFKNLIQVILDSKEFDTSNPGRLMAQIHTEINLDSRFEHQGGGQWALREWSYRGGKLITVKPDRPAARPASKNRFLLDDELEEDDAAAEDSDDDDHDADADADAIEEPIGADDEDADESADEWE